MTRAQLDLDESDLPNPLLDAYVRDGFNRIIELETRWPFYEWVWDVSAPAAGYLPMPTDAREVTSVMGPYGRLMHIDARHAEDWFGYGGGSSTPGYWSQLASSIQLWPQPMSEAMMLRLRGWRKPADWVGQGASANVDADDRLHLPIVWYCCAVGYAQQEDEVLEKVYMDRFNQSVIIAHDDVMRPWSGTPKIVNGYGNVAVNRQQFVLAGSATGPNTPGSPNTGINGGTP
jgi:hypothetical protein